MGRHSALPRQFCPGWRKGAAAQTPGPTAASADQANMISRGYQQWQNIRGGWQLQISAAAFDMRTLGTDKFC